MRRQGLQAALLHARMSYAFDHGCDLAMMVAEPTGSLDRTAQALFFDVTAENADQRCSMFLLPQNGQAVFSLSCSAIVRILENVFLQPLQKNS